MNSTISETILQAVFFDFDGVIVDSVDIKTDAFRIMFHQYGDEVVQKIADYHHRHGGISRVEKISYAHRCLIGAPLTDDQLGRWAEDYSKLVKKKVTDAAWIAGAEEFLVSMTGGVKVFVISGTPQDELRDILKARKMSHHFLEILGSPVKKPIHIRNLLKQYELSPERCIFVGDSLTDYNAAAETGLHFIGIRGKIDFPAGTIVLPDCSKLQRGIEKVLRQ